MMDNQYEKMNIQWFPGHMTKAQRMIEENLKMVDAVCEILDARIPRSSRNPDIDRLAGDKPRLVILNRTDLADPAITARWRKYFEAQGLAILETDARSGKGVNGFAPAVRRLLAGKIREFEAKGQVGRPLRVMILGIPNVGKSSLINRLAGSNKAKTADKPGVTRAKQWIRLGGNLELLDTPGILWPKFEDMTAGLKLAFTGAINDEAIDRELITGVFLQTMAEMYPDRLRERYKLAGDLPSEPHELLELIGRKRGCLVKGGIVDTEKAQRIVLTDFRSGKLGTVSLDMPPQDDGMAEDEQ